MNMETNLKTNFDIMNKIYNRVFLPNQIVTVCIDDLELSGVLVAVETVPEEPWEEEGIFAISKMRFSVTLLIEEKQ